ncbi:LysR family transcriptional regulator [Brevibacillus thermoruber]|uniref:LysR family transcriptional regulator n=1 Tax=Brevibacillus thermoruber TaxID=33942 RepID=UPI0006899223|nr:LysR family transcriptional regulator [Brevibacillus thermoruber]
MELSDLRIFQTVAEHGSVSRAARELNYVQSNVTARIQHLERKLGTSLFYRHARGVTLNPDGRKLLAYAQKILAMMDEMEKAFQDEENPSGPLLIGSVETVSCLPAILSVYCRRYPRVDLSLVTGVTEHLVSEVLAYELDGAFVSGPIEHPEIVQELLTEEELVLITSGDGAPHSLDECKTRPLLVFRSGCGYRARLVQWLAAEGITPARIMEFGTLETILAVVASGLGVSLVPRAAVAHLEAAGRIRCHSIPREFGSVSTVFIRRRDAISSSSMRKLLETIRGFRDEGGTGTSQPEAAARS